MITHRSVPHLFHEVASQHPAKAAYKVRRDGTWVDITWSQVDDTVRRVSRGLMALDVRKGDRVAIVSNTRLEWQLADFGIVNAGAVTVGVYQSNLGPECAYILNHSEAVVVFVENDAQLQKIVPLRGELPHVRAIVIFDGPSDPAHDVHSLDDFLALADGVPPERLDEREASLTPADLATLVYTSGTTGQPKGVMISHKNLLFTTWSACQVIYAEPHWITFLFLPLAHVYARLTTYDAMRIASTIAFCDDLGQVAQRIREVRPYYFPSVPRIYEKIYDKIVAGVESSSPLKRRLFYWAVGVGTRVSKLQQAGKPIPALLRLRRAVAQKLVFAKIQAAFGGRLVFCISGAAPLSQAIAEFFHACGVLILEGIGMTENTSFSNVNQMHANKFGTVGRVGPGIECRIAEDGEVLFRGDNVMEGYYKNPEATAETITEDGWLKTGDIGQIDADGFLKITDRKKDLIITAGGKNVAPQRIEKIMQGSRFINQAMAYGDRRKFITALVTLDPDTLREWAAQNGLAGKSLAELAADPKVHELIRSEIDERNTQLASFETVKRFHILPGEFTLEGGELTPTLKLKRRVVTQKHQALLDALYAEERIGA